MSHIPASAMPHAKPHDEHGEHGDASSHPAPPTRTPAAEPQTQLPRSDDDQPEAKAPASDTAAESGTVKASGTASVPLLAIAAVSVVAIGGIVAATLALRSGSPSPEPKPKRGAKPKLKGRSRKAPKPE